MLVAALLVACEKDPVETSPPAEAPAQRVEAPAVVPEQHRTAARPIFADRPTLKTLLSLGDAIRITEAWFQLRDQADASHCYSVVLQVDDIAEARETFAAQLESLGLPPKESEGAIDHNEQGQRIVLLRADEPGAVLVLACWNRPPAEARAGFAELIPEEPPLSSAAEIAGPQSELEQVQLEWTATRGTSLLISGRVEPKNADAVAAWLADRGYGPVRTDGVGVLHEHGDHVESHAAVRGSDGHWVVELTHAGTLSPFAAL